MTAQDGLTDGINGILINKIENGYIYPNKQCPFKIGAKIFRNQDVEFEKLLAQKCRRQIGVSIEFVDGFINATDEDNIQIKYQIPNGEKAKNAEKESKAAKCKAEQREFYKTNVKNR